MERSVILSDGRMLNAPLAELRSGREGLDSDGTLESLERQYIIRVLRDTSGGYPGSAWGGGQIRDAHHSPIQNFENGNLSPGI